MQSNSMANNTVYVTQYLVAVQGRTAGQYFTPVAGQDPAPDRALEAAAGQYPSSVCTLVRDQRGKLVTRSV